MPELPEVETICRGILPYAANQVIAEMLIREHRLRWPVYTRLPHYITGACIQTVTRRAKYLLLNTTAGSLIIHFGMSGILRIITDATAAKKHDHIDLVFRSGTRLRFHDPRRFGSIHWTQQDPMQHRLLRNLGPEPLAAGLGEHLFQCSRKRRAKVKSFIMDSHIVSGIGNIYANEALFMAQIHPAKEAKQITKKKYQFLANSLQQVLREAIKQGGTSLQDFLNPSGQPGYFKSSLRIYGRQSQPCIRCQRPIQEQHIAQRSSFYCPHCQT